MSETLGFYEHKQAGLSIFAHLAKAKSITNMVNYHKNHSASQKIITIISSLFTAFQIKGCFVLFF